MGARKTALILMKNSHFDRTPQYAIVSTYLQKALFAVSWREEKVLIFICETQHSHAKMFEYLSNYNLDSGAIP